MKLMRRVESCESRENRNATRQSAIAFVVATTRTMFLAVLLTAEVLYSAALSKCARKPDPDATKLSASASSSSTLGITSSEGRFAQNAST